MAQRKKAAAKRAKTGKVAARPARPQHRPRAPRGGKGPAVAARLEPAQLAAVRAFGRLGHGRASALIAEGLALAIPRAARALRAEDPEDYEFTAKRARKELEAILEELAGASSLDESGAQAARDELERMLKG